MKAMKKELFSRFGYALLSVAFLYGCGLNYHYGTGFPHGVEEWIGEMFVGMFIVAGFTFVAVGRHQKKKDANERDL